MLYFYVSNEMAIKYSNPENKEFSGIIVTGNDRKKILKSLSSRSMERRSLKTFSKTLKTAKNLTSKEK